MTEEQLKKFIKDTKGLIRGAAPEKKIRLLKLIKEAKRKCDEAKLDEMSLDTAKVDETVTSALSGAFRQWKQRIAPNQDKTADYLDEK